MASLSDKLGLLRAKHLPIPLSSAFVLTFATAAFSITSKGAELMFALHEADKLGALRAKHSAICFLL